MGDVLSLRFDHFEERFVAAQLIEFLERELV